MSFFFFYQILNPNAEAVLRVNPEPMEMNAALVSMSLHWTVISGFWQLMGMTSLLVITEKASKGSFFNFITHMDGICV